jgi:acetyl-CoA carboxylase beta subunit
MKNKTEPMELNEWIALNVMGWILWREEEYPHRDGYSLGDEYGEKCLACDMPDYACDATAAMEVLKHCMKHLDRLTGRTDFQIVVLYDEGSLEPYSMMTDSTKPADDMTHVRNCAAAETMELAICRFAKNLHENRRVAEPANIRS